LKPVIPTKSLEYSEADKLEYIAETLNRHSLQFLQSSMFKESIPTIRNEIKLPPYTRFYTNYEVKYNAAGTFGGESKEYLYSKKPPSLEEILKSPGSKKIFKSMETQEFNQELFGESTKDFEINMKNAGEKQRINELDRKLK